MTQESQQPHKRRVRYKGKYPKKFEEKYKELQPEKYQDTIQHVIQKGNTPAGMHISIMVKEILDFLEIQPGQTGFDATLGYGGHTKAMLECLQGKGHMYATDVDHGRGGQDKETSGRAGLWRGYSDDQASELLYQSMKSPKRWAVSTSCWQTWAYPLCRSTIRSVVSPSK